MDMEYEDIEICEWTWNMWMDMEYEDMEISVHVPFTSLHLLHMW